jgi:hypothetical protein
MTESPLGDGMPGEESGVQERLNHVTDCGRARVHNESKAGAARFKT